jgi:hypothetical protein
LCNRTFTTNGNRRAHHRNMHGGEHA